MIKLTQNVKFLIQQGSTPTGEHLCQSVISIKLQSNFMEIVLHERCSLVNLLHIFRTPFPQNNCGGLLLVIFKQISEKQSRALLDLTKTDKGTK